MVSWIIRIIVVAALIAAIYFLFFNNGKQRDIAGVPDPIQAEAEGHVDMEIDDYQIGIDYLKSYDISALVVGTENYSWGGIGDELGDLTNIELESSAASGNGNIKVGWILSNSSAPHIVVQLGDGTVACQYTTGDPSDSSGNRLFKVEAGSGADPFTS